MKNKVSLIVIILMIIFQIGMIIEIDNINKIVALLLSILIFLSYGIILVFKIFSKNNKK